MHNNKLVTWNVNSLYASLEDNTFFKFVERVDADFIALQEIMVDPNSKKWKLKSARRKLRRMGYSEYWNAAKQNSGDYAGTAIFTRFKPVEVVIGPGTTMKVGLWLWLSMTSGY